MILNGWKEIAHYLGCGMRTAQRWELNGLPVLRPVPGKRSHVLVNSEQMDLWMSHRQLRPETWAERKETLQRAQKLRAEVQQARHDLHLNMDALRDEMAGLMSRRRRS